MSTSEQSYGAKMKRAQDLLINLSGIPVYSPPREQEGLAELTQLAANAGAQNDSVAQRLENYSLTVDARYKSYHSNDGSLKKLADQVKSNIQALYGKNSKEFKDVKALVAKIKGTRLVAKPKPDEDVKMKEKTTSTSHQSYGSLLQYYRDLVNVLQQFPSYTSNNTQLSIDNLLQQAQLFNDLNAQVTQSNQSLNSARSQRNALYAELKERCSRAQAYIRAEYGKDSMEIGYFKGLSL